MPSLVKTMALPHRRVPGLLLLVLEVAKRTMVVACTRQANPPGIILAEVVKKRRLQLLQDRYLPNYRKRSRMPKQLVSPYEISVNATNRQQSRKGLRTGLIIQVKESPSMGLPMGPPMATIPTPTLARHLDRRQLVQEQ